MTRIRSRFPQPREIGLVVFRWGAFRASKIDSRIAYGIRTKRISFNNMVRLIFIGRQMA
jgi:hypothetical protein